MPDFSVDVAEHEQGLVVRMTGDAGVTHAPALERELTKTLLRRPAVVVFDLAGLEFISSLAIGTLVHFRRGIAAHGGEVRLAALPQLIHDAFNRTRLDVLFPMFDTVEAALDNAAPG